MNAGTVSTEVLPVPSLLTKLINNSINFNVWFVILTLNPFSTFAKWFTSNWHIAKGFVEGEYICLNWSLCMSGSFVLLSWRIEGYVKKPQQNFNIERNELKCIKTFNLYHSPIFCYLINFQIYLRKNRNYKCATW